MRWAPRIDRRCDRRVMRGESAFGHLQFAHHDRACRFKASHYSRVAVRHKILMNGHPRRSGNTFGIAKVLYANRNPMQGPSAFTPADLSVGLSSGSERQFGCNSGVASEMDVKLRNALQQCLSYFDRRELARTNPPPDINKAQVAKIVWGHRGNLASDVMCHRTFALWRAEEGAQRRDAHL